MPKVSSLTGEIVLEVNKWTAGIKQVQTDTKALEKAFLPITNIAAQAGTALLAMGTAAVGALVAVTKISADYGDKIRDASVRTGLATETLSGLKYQAEQTGASFDDLNSGLKFLSKNFAEAAAQGKGKAAEAFNAIGISVKELRAANGELEPVLRKVMDRISLLPSASDRAAASMALLGKGAANLSETLAGGSAAMDEFRKRAEFFGLTVGKDATEKADAFNDALNDLKQAALGISLALGNQLIPMATEWVVWITAATVTLKDFIAQFSAWGVVLKEFAKGNLKLPDLMLLVKTAFDEAAKSTIKNKMTLEELIETERARLKGLALTQETLVEVAKAEEDRAKAVKKAADEAEKVRQEQITQYISLTKLQMDRDEMVWDNLKVLADLSLKEINKYYDERAKAAIDATNAEIESYIGFNNVVREQLEDRADLQKDINDAILKSANDHLEEWEKVTQKQVDVSERAAEQTRQVWIHAVGNITSDFAKGLSDIIFEGKKFSDAMKDIAKNTAKSMFDAFLTGLLTPLTSKLAGLGSQLGGILMGGGGGAGGGNNAFPGLPGAAAIPGILGKGGGGSAAGGAAMGLGGAALMGGITAGLPLLISGIGKIGSGHRAANEIVKSQEAIVSQINAVIRDETLSALNRLKIANNLFAGFQSNTQAFAQGGSANAKVANQAFAGLAPWWTGVQTSLQRAIGEDKTEGSGTVNNYNFTINLSEGKNARATGALIRDEIIPAIVDAIKTNTGGLTAAISVGVKNSIAGVVTT